MNTTALVSIGAHPASGRPCRTEQDAYAVEPGLYLSGPRSQVLHVGDPYTEALRGYLGMGLERSSVLGQPADTDVLPALTEHLHDSRAQLVLTGSQVETGGDSGMPLFPLAKRLGWPLVVGLVEVEKVEDGNIQVLQALPHGRRRWLRVYLPFVTNIGNAAPAARQSTFGSVRRGETEAYEMEMVDDLLFAKDSLQPTRL